MSEEETTTQAATDTPEERPPGMINAQSALRLLLVLLAIWTFFSGLALVFFQGGADATIGGGLGGDDGSAAQRLLGVHLLVLAALYGLIVWRPQQYESLIWVPYAAQAGVVIVTFFDIITNKRDFTDGALPLIVAAVFLVLFLYVWRAARQQPPVPPAEGEAERPGGSAAESAPATIEPEKQEQS